MTKYEILDLFEMIMHELVRVNKELENEADKFVINNAIKLIDSVAWKYEGDE